MIRKIHKQDVEKLDEFYELMIRDTFEKEGIGHLEGFIQEELTAKHNYSISAIDDSSFVDLWVLEKDHEIIGTIGLAPISELIERHYPEAKNLLELHTLFVHPNMHNKGYASKMIKEVFEILKDKEERVVLDSGYTIAKQIWKKRFGEPMKILKDHWGEGIDHYIWDVSINESLKFFNKIC